MKHIKNCRVKKRKQKIIETLAISSISLTSPIGGAPMMRVNGQLYSTMSRRSEHCWFFVDGTFDPYYKNLTK